MIKRLLLWLQIIFLPAAVSLAPAQQQAEVQDALPVFTTSFGLKVKLQRQRGKSQVQETGDNL
jgi:hypothetical protein